MSARGKKPESWAAAIRARAAAQQAGGTPGRIVVLGECNSGKTTLVNGLVGAPLLPASVVTHTACPTVVGFAPRPALRAELADRRRVPLAWEDMALVQGHDVRRLDIGMPLRRLRGLSIIDTPGLDADDAASRVLALQSCRGADLAIWCTPAMQAWKESERRAWLSLPRRLRQRGFLAVTFADKIRSRSDLDRLLARLRSEAGGHFQEVLLARPAPARAGQGERSANPATG
jgi:hypothetical protein